MNSTEFIIGFQDETSPQTTANSVLVWSDGRPVRIKNTEKMRLSTFGFYALNGRSSIAFPKGSKKADMCTFLRAVRDENGDAPIVMVLDNNPVHHANDVKECAEGLDIVLMFLPPYSPQYNPIELIWKSGNRKVSRAFPLCREHLEAVVRESFEEESAKRSYSVAWEKKFLSNIILKPLV